MENMERSMYDTIMSLPLLQGIGKDHVSSFLEKTKILISKYEIGDKIIEEGEDIKGIIFVLSGSVETEISCLNGEGVLKSKMDSPLVLSATNLFGMETLQRQTVKATAPTSILAFSKEKYIELLRSDRIYLINYVNYLSSRIQLSRQLINNSGLNYPVDLLKSIVIGNTSKQSYNIRIEMSSGNRLKEIFPMKHKGLYALCDAGVIRYEKSILFVNDRRELEEF